MTGRQHSSTPIGIRPCSVAILLLAAVLGTSTSSAQQQRSAPRSKTVDDARIEGFWLFDVPGTNNSPTLKVDRKAGRLRGAYGDQFSDAHIEELEFDGTTLRFELQRDVDGRLLRVAYRCRLEQQTLRGTLDFEFDDESARLAVTGKKVDEEEFRRHKLRIGEACGPFLGHLSSTSAKVWYRAPQAGSYTLKVQGDSLDKPRVVEARASAEDDFCVVWSVDQLQPKQTYGYSISTEGQPVVSGDEFAFRTPPPVDEPQSVRLAFASCASEDEGTRRAWRQMRAQYPHDVILLGDTPYIDSTNLEIQRMRYGQFAAVPEFAELLRTRPLYGTWDDHDFGRNDSDGRLAGKENSRRAFIEYHALPSYGDGTKGIYTSFRRGGAEVFLLDARTFAGTEPSPFDANQKTLLGEKQWQWLRDRLLASKAPFKILASGMIFNGATRPNKTDHWMHYPHERDGLFRFLGENQITGVVLVAGDIHRSRALRHRVGDVVGYNVLELITSPMHDSIIEAANAPHPDLLFDAGEPHSFLIVECDTRQQPPKLRAQFLNAEGKELYFVEETAN